MKNSNKVIRGALILAVVLWFAAPIIALYPSLVYSYIAPACQSADVSTPALAASAAERCSLFMAKQGQSGDLFGATTSIFSGLALFAVAFTLYADLTHRRRERKPLIACDIGGENYISFDKPSADAEPKAFYFRGKLSVNSISETAINTVVHPTLLIKNTEHRLGPVYIGIPMKENSSHAIELSDLLSKPAIDAICESPQQLAQILLHLRTTCSNLEGEQFSSEVTYKVSLKFPDTLNKVMSIRHAGPGIDGAWDDRSAVPLDCKLEPNSWKFTPLSE